MKLNAAGIKYIAEMWENFEEHLNKLASAIRNKETDVELSDCKFWSYPYTIGWTVYWRGEVDDSGSIHVTEDELCCRDYEAIREKYKKIREDKRIREQKAAEAAAKAREEAAEEKRKQDAERAVEIEKDLVRKLLKKYPELLLEKQV